MHRLIQLCVAASCLLACGEGVLAQDLFYVKFGGNFPADCPLQLHDRATRTPFVDFSANAPSLEDTPVFLVQIEIRTADRDNAEQRDGVKIRLNSSNETWLLAGVDDFVRGQSRTYDLSLGNAAGVANVTQLRDVQFLEISKTGSDGWCFSEVELIINGRTFYKAHYPRGQWLDNSGGARLVHTISGTTLRDGAEWNNSLSTTLRTVSAR